MTLSPFVPQHYGPVSSGSVPGNPHDVPGYDACRIYNSMAGVTGPIYGYNHCRTGDIAKTQVTHITKDTGLVNDWAEQGKFQLLPRTTPFPEENPY